jgi:hypothetical protein
MCYTHLFFFLPWIGLVTEIGLKQPSHASDEDIGCFFCGTLMGAFRGDWWRDPFKRYTTTKHIHNYPGAVFSNLPLTKRRYCMMHGANANLSNSLMDCYNIFPFNSSLKTEYKKIIKSVAPKWEPTVFMEPVKTKAFFAKHIQEQLVDLFRRCRGIYDIPWPGQETRLKLPTWKVVALLLDSVRIYQEFAYTEWPTPTDFETLETRTGLLAVYAGMKWRLKPTIHFTTNEALDFAREDGTMYHTLNEGAEAAHKELKEMASNSMKNIPITQTGEMCFEHVVNLQETQRTLRKKGYAPPEWSLTQIDPNTLLLPSTNITPPQFLPEFN